MNKAKAFCVDRVGGHELLRRLEQVCLGAFASPTSINDLLWKISSTLMERFTGDEFFRLIGEGKKIVLQAQFSWGEFNKSTNKGRLTLNALHKTTMENTDCCWTEYFFTSFTTWKCQKFSFSYSSSSASPFHFHWLQTAQLSHILSELTLKSVASRATICYCLHIALDVHIA